MSADIRSSKPKGLWKIKVEGDEAGPFTFEQIEDLVKNGDVLPTYPLIAHDDNARRFHTRTIADLLKLRSSDPLDQLFTTLQSVNDKKGQNRFLSPPSMEQQQASSQTPPLWKTLYNSIGLELKKVPSSTWIAIAASSLGLIFIGLGAKKWWANRQELVKSAVTEPATPTQAQEQESSTNKAAAPPPPKLEQAQAQQHSPPPPSPHEASRPGHPSRDDRAHLERERELAQEREREKDREREREEREREQRERDEAQARDDYNNSGRDPASGDPHFEEPQRPEPNDSYNGENQ